ncbi:MAG: MFS transporter [Chloroflexi bacterium]|nr:MFS transporter [Chloroflexota bacterium]
MREQLRVVLAVARDPGLARIELAYLGFNMAEYATWIAILVWAYTRGGAAAAALVAFIQLMPAALMAPFAAYAGDRYRQDRVLLAAYLLQAATLAATGIALYLDAPFPLVVLAATLASVSFTVTRPVQAVMLPSVTHTPADLTAANTVSGLSESIGIFIGPFVGGVVLGRFGPGEVFLTFSFISFIAAVLVARLPIFPAAVASTGTLTARERLAESFGGFAALRRERRVMVLVLVLSASTVVIGALDILFAAVAIDLLHAGEAWAGFLYSAFGLGGIVGTVATVALVGRRRMTPAFAGSSGLFGFSISAIGLVATTVSAPALFAASGAGSSITTVAGRTLLQRTAPEAVMARVFGVLEGLAMFALAVGAVASGMLVESIGVSGALLVVGLLVPTVLALTWVQLGALDRNAKAPDPEALELLRRLPIFAPLSAISMEKILADMDWLHVPAGAVVIREGDEGDRFYVIADGRVAVTFGGAHLSMRGPGDGIGEIALLRNVPRTATVTAVTPLRLIVVERVRFLAAVTGHAQSRERAEATADAQLRNTAAPG